MDDMYTDSVPEDCDFGEDAVAMIQHLLVAAKMYDLPRLKLICKHKLCSLLDVNSAANTLALAEQHHCFALKEAILMFLEVPLNMKVVRCTDCYKHMLESCLSIYNELRLRCIL